MPEGDTVALAASRLHDRLAGDVLTVSDLRTPALATVDLRGKRMLEVAARGKHLLMRLEDDLTLHSHLKMEGAWRIYVPGARWRGPAHEVRAVVGTERATAVGFRLGALDLVRTSEEDSLIGHLGPDPLGDDWDRAVALANLEAEPHRSVSDALLDQRVIAGLGNVYRCELCFLVGVHPDAPVSHAPLQRLVVLAERALRANRTTGMQVTTGDARRGRQHWVYGRREEPCRRCGTPIRRSESSSVERVTYWCPHCQPQDPVSTTDVRVEIASDGGRANKADGSET